MQKHPQLTPQQEEERTIIGRRFKEERLRYDAGSGRSLLDASPSGLSKRVIRAVEDGLGAVKPRQIPLLISLGFDVRYILHGDQLPARDPEVAEFFDHLARLAEPDRQALLKIASTMARATPSPTEESGNER